MIVAVIFVYIPHLGLKTMFTIMGYGKKKTLSFIFFVCEQSHVEQELWGFENQILFTRFAVRRTTN